MFCWTGQEKCQQVQSLYQPVFASRRNVQPLDVQRRAEEAPVSRLQRGLRRGDRQGAAQGTYVLMERQKYLFGDTEAGTGDIMTAARALRGLGELV